jgi:DMSO/TMAO reductase YedYZ molybdopterin-dependent catalytic subunit
MNKAPDIERELARKTRRSFVVGGAAAAVGLAGWTWLATREKANGIQWPLRKTLRANERIAQAYYRPSRLSPEFPRSEAVREARINGDEGMSDDFDPDTWKLRIENTAASNAPVELTLDEVRKMPRAEHVTELKCVEGWSYVQQWAGVRFSDFAKKFPLSPDCQYVALETPDKGYYVGLDLPSAMHPQTLLCYEMNDVPLEDEHGAPLRLVIPTKYGIKNLKRIGTIRYAAQRPADYWAERGYDWYAGL